MHILADVMAKVRQDEIRPKVQRVMQLERIREEDRVLTLTLVLLTITLALTCTEMKGPQSPRHQQSR